MIALLALTLVSLTGLYLIVLGVISFLAPALASKFFLGFAGSALAHYAELTVRLGVGGAFVLHSPYMPFPGAFSAFGWVLLITTAALFLVPWQWHHRFAQRSVPHALRYLRPIGVVSTLLGGVILAAVIRGGA